jgi:predicted transcriptional regulator of viral defense system
MCLNVRLFDAIAAHGHGVTLEQAHELLPGINPSSVTSAAHRLSCSGALTLHRNGKTIVYNAKAGVQPADGRGRPRRIVVAPRSATSD